MLDFRGEKTLHFIMSTKIMADTIHGIIRGLLNGYVGCGFYGKRFSFTR